MADKINITRLLKQINEFGHDANRSAVSVTNETANKIANQARLRAPVDINQLRLSIGKTTARVGFNTSVIFANAPYAGFVEFGTGSRVKIPKGFEELAAAQRGKASGNFDEFLDNIRDWCRKKGIDVKLAYIIAVSILRKGLKPQPYFIPSYLEGVQEYPKQLEKILAREVRNLNAKK